MIFEKVKRFLLWLQKYTKIDMLYVAKGGSWLTFGQIAASGTAFLLSLAFANFLPPTIYGTYKYLLSVAEIIGYFTFSGLSAALIPTVSRGNDGVLRYSFWLNVRWSTIATAVSFGTAMYYTVHGNTLFAIALLIIGISTPWLKSASFASSFLNGKKDFKRKTLYETGNTVISGVAMLVAILTTTNLAVLISVYFISHTVLALVFYMRTLAVYPAPKSNDTGMVQYAKHVTIMNILGIVYENADKILIFQFLGPRDLAIYTFATAVPDQVRNVLKRIHLLALPKLAQKNIKEAKQATFSRIKMLWFFLLPLTIGYILIAPIAFQIFFPQYLSSVIYSQIYALTFFGYANLSTQTLNAMQAVRENYILTISSFCIRLTLIVVLGLHFGIWGFLFSELGTKLCNNLLALFLVHRLKAKL